MRTLLVVGPDADPAGSGADLLDVLSWVRGHHPDVAIHVLLLRGGALIHRFHALGPTTAVDWYDRRADQRRAATIVRGPRRQRWLARLIDRVASATLPRRLPRIPADVVLVQGWDALSAGALGARRTVPRVVLVPAGATDAAGWVGATGPAGGRRRARRALRRAAEVLVDTAADQARPAAAWGTAEGIVAHLDPTGAPREAGSDRGASRAPVDVVAELAWDALVRAAAR